MKTSILLILAIGISGCAMTSGSLVSEEKDIWLNIQSSSGSSNQGGLYYCKPHDEPGKVPNPTCYPVKRFGSTGPVELKK